MPPRPARAAEALRPTAEPLLEQPIVGAVFPDVQQRFVDALTIWAAGWKHDAVTFAAEDRSHRLRSAIPLVRGVVEEHRRVVDDRVGVVVLQRIERILDLRKWRAVDVPLRQILRG